LGGILEVNIKVVCKNKNCGWVGQAIVGKKGLDLDKYRCPECGQDIKRGRGNYDFYSESAQLK